MQKKKRKRNKKKLIFVLVVEKTRLSHIGQRDIKWRREKVQQDDSSDITSIKTT
jgi:hypothetical protein